MSRWITLVVLAAVAAIGLFAASVWRADYGPVKAAPENTYRLQRHPCDFTLPEGMAVDCASLHTPARAGGFRLPVMILRYRGKDRREAPLVYLQGGPGAAAGIHREGLEYWWYWREHAGLRRDLILFDRRGGGNSQPSLFCQSYEHASRDWLGEHMSAAEEMARGLVVLRQCVRDELPHFQVERYGTRASARDLLALVEELQLQAGWHLLGVSYGSRLAIEAAPQAKGLKTLVLDSVYPPGFGGLDTWPQVLGEALEDFFAACLEETRCRALWQREKGDLSSPEQALYRALETLRREPLRLSVRVGDWPEEVVVNDHRLLAAVFSASYNSHRRQQAMAAILAVTRGDTASVEALVAAWVWQAFSEDLASLAFTAVDCRDGALGSDEVFNQSLAEYPQLVPYVGGVREHSICREWVADAPLQVASLSIPVVLLAGEHDPITPSSWAQWLQRRWPQAQTMVFPGVGHSVLGSEPCALSGLGVWLDAPDAGWPQCASTQ